ncbi:MAG: GNAT family N-acetyltransferase [Flavobacteriales bacterium]|nr:GNAT family N-acetyltransferase [Flavobacteriales bacterium]
MNSTQPVFSHPLLYLRKINTEDAEFLLTLNANPEVMKYTGEAPWQSLPEAQLFIEQNYQLSIKGIERWLVCLPNGKPIGLAGFRIFDDLPEQWDISFRFLPEYWNQGYAFITVQILTHHALYVSKQKALRAQVHEENLPSSRVLEKCGYQLDHRFTWGGMIWRCYYVRQKDFQVLPEILADLLR